MKLTTKKYFAFFLACLIVCFSIVAFLGIHSRWGYTIHNHIKGWQNLHLSQDFDKYTRLRLHSVQKNVKIGNEKNIATIKKRLNSLGIFDHRISVNKKINSIILDYAQPATSAHDYDPQTIVNIAGAKGTFKIDSSDPIKNPNIKKDKHISPISRKDIESIKIDIKKNDNEPESLKDVEPEYGLTIQLTKAGTKKLADLTEQIISENASLSLKKDNKNNTNSNKKLAVSLNNLVIYTQPLMTPIVDGKIQMFNGFNVEQLKRYLAYLNNPELQSNLCLTNLQKISPELGNRFKMGSAIILLAILIAIAIILIVKFKLVGLICCICLTGHTSFILACFTGFFSIYPGVDFNLGSFVGSMVSFAISIASCFVISKSIQDQQTILKIHPFSLAVKNGLNSACKLISSWNVRLIVSSIVLMAIFSYKTNLVAFMMQPIYNLLNIEMCFDPTVSAIAYALFVGSVGALIFETIIIRYIMEPITSQKINLNLSKIIAKLKSIAKSNKDKIKKVK